MKNIGLLISSIGAFIVILVNLYYNSITLDIQMIKDYVLESNIILEDMIKKEDHVNEKKDEYISRLLTLKRGIENSKTTFLTDNYKEYRVKSIEALIEGVSQEENKQEYLQQAQQYNEMSEKELEKLVNKN